MALRQSKPDSSTWNLQSSIPVAQEPRDVGGEADLGVVLRLVADDLAGVGDAPEGAGVVGDAVEDVEGDAVLVLDRGCLDRLAEELPQVALADVAGQVANVALARLVDELRGVDLARRDDADLDHLELAPEAAAGVDEAQRLVGRLGPAVEAVRARVVLRADAVAQALVVRLLVP